MPMLRTRRRRPVNFGVDDPVPVTHSTPPLDERSRTGQNGERRGDDGCAQEQDRKREQSHTKDGAPKFE